MLPRHKGEMMGQNITYAAQSVECLIKCWERLKKWQADEQM